MIAECLAAKTTIIESNYRLRSIIQIPDCILWMCVYSVRNNLYSILLQYFICLTIDLMNKSPIEDHTWHHMLAQNLRYIPVTEISLFSNSYNISTVHSTDHLNLPKVCVILHLSKRIMNHEQIKSKILCIKAYILTSKLISVVSCKKADSQLQ